MFDTLKRINPKILGQKLKQARIARGLRQEDAAETLGVVRTTLVAMEQGVRRVTAKELVALAELYARPLSEWLGEEPAPVPLVPQFRMPSDQTHFSESQLQRVVGELESLARDYLELERINGMPLVRRYSPVYEYEAPGVPADVYGEEVAVVERTRLGLGDGPLLNLRALLEESVGLRIFYFDLLSAIGGLYAYSEDLGACVAINRLHPAPRATWSLAHEYGHFLTTRFTADVSLWDQGPWGKAAPERFADAFAKNFLMPRTGVNRLLTEAVRSHRKGVTVADVMTLGHQFRVSAEAMFRRLEELKRLPSGTWDTLRQERFEPDKARTALGLLGSEHPEPMFPFRYRMLAMWAYDRRQTLTEAQLAHFLRMDRVQAREELDQLRLMADEQSDTGFESFGLEPDKVLVPA